MAAQAVAQTFLQDGIMGGAAVVMVSAVLKAVFSFLLSLRKVEKEKTPKSEPDETLKVYLTQRLDDIVRRIGEMHNAQENMKIQIQHLEIGMAVKKK